jgi:hypothetical protein
VTFDKFSHDSVTAQAKVERANTRFCEVILKFDYSCLSEMSKAIKKISYNSVSKITKCAKNYFNQPSSGAFYRVYFLVFYIFRFSRYAPRSYIERRRIIVAQTMQIALTLCLSGFVILSHTQSYSQKLPKFGAGMGIPSLDAFPNNSGQSRRTAIIISLKGAD